MGGVAAAAAIAMGLKNIQAIRSAGKDGVKSTGGVPTPSMSGGTPAPEMLSGRFELTPTTEQQPVQAYVVTDNLTDNQNKVNSAENTKTFLTMNSDVIFDPGRLFAKLFGFFF